MKKQQSQKLQSDQKTTKLVHIDAELHRLLKTRAAEDGVAMRELLEGCLAELLEVKK